MARSLGVTLILGSDPEQVREACSVLATRLKLSFYIAAAPAPWTAIYPQQCGQDPSPAAELSAQLATEAVHLLLHDGDFTAYHYFDSGEIVEEWCHPHDYFGIEGTQEPPPPDKIARLFARGAESDALAAWTESASRVQAEALLEELARHLGVEGLPGAFEEIEDKILPPAVAPEGLYKVEPIGAAAARKRERAAIREATRELEEQGLLVEETSRRADDSVLHPMPRIAAADDGYLLAWSTSTGLVRTERPSWLRRLGQDHPVLPELSSRAFCLNLGGPNRRLLAVGNASGDWSFEIYDLASGDRLVRLPQARAVSWVGFAPDDSLVAALSEDELTLVPLRGTQPEAGAAAQVKLPRHGREGAFHPHSACVAIVTQDGLCVVDMARHSILTHLDLWRRDLRAWERAVAQGEVESSYRETETARTVDCDSSGRYLAIGTDQGARVVEWQAFIEGRLEMIATAAAPLAKVADFRMRGTNSCRFTPDGRSLLYAGLEGSIRSLDLASGDSTELVELPGSAPVIRLLPSLDFRWLATVARPRMFDRKPPPPTLQVWDFRKLLES